MAECRVSDRLPVTRVGKVAARERGATEGGTHLSRTLGGIFKIS